MTFGVKQSYIIYYVSFAFAQLFGKEGKVKGQTL